MIDFLDNEKLVSLGIKIDTSTDTVQVVYPSTTSQTILRDLLMVLGGDCKFIEVEEKDIEHGLFNTEASRSELYQLIGEPDFDEAARMAFTANDENDAPLVKLLNNLISNAITRNASDLHLDVTPEGLQIKIRINGTLVQFATLEKRVARMLTTRIKLLSRLDITERRKPQDGQISLDFNNREIDIRVATLPVKDSERIVMRFFTASQNAPRLHDIGLPNENIKSIENALSRQSGLILVCGPTGSGKTTTIYSMLSLLVDRGLSVMSIEDPVEIDLKGVVQTQVNDSISYGFAEGLRALLRNDPDVILIGEIRDEETAVMAIRAALTGHLVISTVHANNPVTAIRRLINLGVDNSLLSDCLNAIYSQRLVKVYCNECKVKSLASPGHVSTLQQSFTGCETCHYTGFSGRKPVMSELEVNPTIKKIVLNSLSDLEFDNQMVQMAKKLFENKEIPWSEVTRLE